MDCFFFFLTWLRWCVFQHSVSSGCIMYDAIIFVWCWFPETSTGLPPAVSSDPLSLDQDSWIGFSFQQFYSITGCFPSLTNPDEPLHRFFSKSCCVNSGHSIIISPKLLVAEDIYLRPMGLPSVLRWPPECPSGLHHYGRSSVLHLGCSSSCSSCRGMDERRRGIWTTYILCMETVALSPKICIM